MLESLCKDTRHNFLTIMEWTYVSQPVMSLIRTDYVPEWRISAHAQSVLAAGQKHHKVDVKSYLCQT